MMAGLATSPGKHARLTWTKICDCLKIDTSPKILFDPKRSSVDSASQVSGGNIIEATGQVLIARYQGIHMIRR